MHYADIIASLVKAGHPPSKVAADLGVSRPTVTKIIRSQESSYNVASYISSVTNIPLSKLWPCGRYSKPRARRKAAAA